MVFGLFGSKVERLKKAVRQRYGQHEPRKEAMMRLLQMNDLEAYRAVQSGHDLEGRVVGEQRGTVVLVYPSLEITVADLAIRIVQRDDAAGAPLRTLGI